ncbi:hypothetical protein D1871_21820 [Nakamurella silvestris]|nr:hypothetical protein D1871_21820 [Nakamurella silvestris]
MRKSTPIGAGLAAFGLLVLGSLFVTSPARADVLVPDVFDFGPRSSSTAGGQVFEAYGENLFGVVKVTFGDVESPEFVYDEYYGQGIMGLIPAHKAGTVPVVAYLDADTVITEPEWETFEESFAETTAPVAGSAAARLRAAFADESTEQTSTEQTSTDQATTTSGSETVTSTAGTGTTDGTELPERSDTLNTSGAVDGLIPVKIGNFTYKEPWTSGLTPSHGPTTGGTVVSLEGPFILNTVSGYCLEDVESMSTASAALAQRITAAKVRPQALELPDVDMEVFFDGTPATEARVVVDKRGNISIKATTPAHEAGKSDVTVVFHGFGCEGQSDSAAAAAELPEFPDHDAVFTRADLFEFTDVPVVETTVTEQVTVTETITQEVPVTLDPVTVTVTPAGPQLAATGVDSSTLPKVLIGLVLFLTGTTVLALGRRPRAH